MLTPHTPEIAAMMEDDVKELTLQGGTDRGRTLRVQARLKGRRYEIIDILADGGMGVLYRARDHRVGGNLVLIKAVKYDASQFGFDKERALYHLYSMRQRFKREKNVLVEMARRGLNHVPALNDFFCDLNPELNQRFPFGELTSLEDLIIGGRRLKVPVAEEPYLVMERVFGRNVRQNIDQLSEARLLEIARAVCLLLERIHQPRGRPDGTDLSFIYMDLKPDNLILDRQGGVWLVDFGAAIPVVNGVRKGKGAYTPGFAAPEVRRIAHPSATVDHRADLYSLGAILYQGLSRGHVDPMSLATPFEDEYPVLDPETLRAELHPKTRQLVLHALARDPEARFSSAEAMRRAIESALREV